MTRPPRWPVAICAIRHATSLASLPEFTKMQASRCAGSRAVSCFRVLAECFRADSGYAWRGWRSAVESPPPRGMRMAHMRYVVVHVEVGAPLRVVQPHPRAAHEVQGLFVEQLGAGAHQPMPPREIDRSAPRRRATRRRCDATVRPRAGSRPPRATLAVSACRSRRSNRCERCRGACRRLVEHPGALAVMLASPRVHQHGHGMTRGDDVVEQLHLVGLQGAGPARSLQHRGHRLERRQPLRSAVPTWRPQARMISGA